MKMHQVNMISEWSHKIDVGTLPDAPFALTIAADAGQCRDLARRLGVKAIDGLCADIRVERIAGTRTYYVTGQIRATVTQICVISAADAVQTVDEPFDAWFADKEAAISLARARHDRMTRYMDAEVPILGEDEDPEPLVDNMIDVGEVAAQFLSLALAPYPRAQGVAAPSVAKDAGDETDGHSRNPFAALKKWKAARGDDG